jgi:hypothetical protein
MNLEQQYKNLNEKSMHRGEKTANDLLMTGAGLAASTALSIGATKISNPYVRTAAEHLGPVIIDGFTKSGGGKKKGK